MFRKITLLLFLLLNLYAQTSVNFTPEEKKWIQTHKTVTLGADYDWPPYDFVDDNLKHSGIAADMLQLISKKSGLRFDVKPDVWSKTMQKMWKKEIDGLTCAVKTPQRERFLLFTTPYATMPLAVIVQNKRNDIRSIDDLRGKTVALNKDSYLHEWMAKNHPEIKLYLATSNKNALEAVAFAKADAYIGNIAVATYIMKNNFLTNLKITTKLAELQTKVCVAIDKDKPILFSIIEKSLQSISDKEKERIIQKWFIHSKASATQEYLFDAKEREWIHKHPVINVGGEYDWAPVDFVEDGEYKGIAKDYLDAISKKTGLKFNVVIDKWENNLKKIKNKQIDMLDALYFDMDRATYMNFTQPYFELSQYFFVRKDIKAKALSDLRGRYVAIPKGYLNARIIEQEFPWMRVKFVDSFQDAVEAVAKGEADVLFDTYAAISYVLQKQGIKNIVPLEVYKKQEHKKIYMSTRKDYEILRSILNKALASITPQEQKEIRRKWLSSPPDYTIFYQFFAVLILIFLGTFYWNRRLAKEVEKRKRIEQELLRSQKLLEEKNKTFTTIYEKATDAILLLRNEKFIDCNEATIKMLGYKSKEEFLNTHPSKLSPPQQPDGRDSFEKAEEMMKIAKERGSHHFEWMHLRSNGEEFWVDVVLTKLYIDNKETIHVRWIDITELKATQQQLERETRKAIEANKAKSEFLSNMSHEIRTPMNAIIGFTELLEEQLSEPKLKSYVRTIKNAGNSLLMLINDILDLSKIEAGKLSIEKKPTDIFKLAEEIESVFILEVQKKGLDLLVDIDRTIPASLYLDEVRLRQILFNLVGNAVKFTQKGHIALRIYPSSEKTKSSKLDLVVEVEDTGIGIPKEQCKRIFNKFEQADGHDTKKFGGTGLGLAISSKLATMMGGELGVKSEEGKGSTFFLKLSDIEVASIVAQNESFVSSFKPQQEFVFKKAKVLIADDVEDNRNLIVKNFENTQVEVITASNGAEAVELVKNEKPDVVLMDIRMPVMDGYEATAIIKQETDIPVIALTASVLKKEENDERENGIFDGFLRKPVLRGELFAMLAKFLPYERLRRSPQEEEKEELFSAEVKEHIGTIRAIFTEKIIPLKNKAAKSNNISEIQMLASVLEEVARTYNIDFIEEFASQLENAVDVFDIAEIERLFIKFDTIAQKIQE